MTRIIENFQNDIRQILGYLEFIGRTKGQNGLNNINNNKNNVDGLDCNNFCKDATVLMTHNDATRRLLNRGTLNSMSMK